MKDNGRLVSVFVSDPFEADVVRGLLESSGIPAMIQDNSLSAVLSSFGSMVRVLVNECNAEEAKRILEEREK